MIKFEQKIMEKTGIITDKKHEIKCTTCGKRLGHIIETVRQSDSKLIPKRPKVFKCYCACNAECFLIKTGLNEPSILTEEPYTIVDMYDKDGTTYIRLGKIK